MKLILESLIKFILGIVLVGLLVFLPAGTFDYPKAWLFIALLFIPMFIFGTYLYIKKPKLLKRRLNNKEKENTQKIVVLISGLLFIAGFIVSALDFKNKWTSIPLWVTILASIVLLIGYCIYIKVMLQNEYLLRTIEVEKEQKLIDTGLYSIVRHPMYFAVLLIFLSIPLILGSLYGFYIFLSFIVVLLIRIKNEEKVLVKELPGYSKYKLKVKYKLIPYVY